MTDTTKALTPIEQAGAAHLLELREIVGDECPDTLAEIDGCLVRLGIEPADSASGEIL